MSPNINLEELQDKGLIPVELAGEVRLVSLVGSKYILGAGLDTDYLLLVSHGAFDSVTAASLSDSITQYEEQVGYGAESRGMFRSFKTGGEGRDVINLLLTPWDEYYYNWRLAADVCRFVANTAHDRMHKEHRVAIHEIICDRVHSSALLVEVDTP